MWWWITESWIPAAVVLGFTALGLVITTVSSGRGIYAIGAVACLALVGVAYLVDEWVVTPSEQVVLRTRSLAAAYVRHSPEDFDEHVSPNAPGIRLMAVGAFNLIDVHDDLRITDVAVQLEDEGKEARIHFRANATIEVRGRGEVGRFPSRWNLDWRREKEEWLLVGVQRLHPIDGTEMGLLAGE